MTHSNPIFGNGNGSGKFHSRLSGRELEAGIPGNSRDREFLLMVVLIGAVVATSAPIGRKLLIRPHEVERRHSAS